MQEYIFNKKIIFTIKFFTNFNILGLRLMYREKMQFSPEVIRLENLLKIYTGLFLVYKT